MYVQEFMLIPLGAASFSEALRMGAETYHCLKDVIKEKYGQDACNVGDEGGFAPNIKSAEEGLDLLKTAIQRAGYTGKIFIGMDVAASEFFKQVGLGYRVIPCQITQNFLSWKPDHLRIFQKIYHMYWNMSLAYLQNLSLLSCILAEIMSFV